MRNSRIVSCHKGYRNPFLRGEVRFCGSPFQDLVPAGTTLFVTRRYIISAQAFPRTSTAFGLGYAGHCMLYLPKQNVPIASLLSKDVSHRSSIHSTPKSVHV